MELSIILGFLVICVVGSFVYFTISSSISNYTPVLREERYFITVITNDAQSLPANRNAATEEYVYAEEYHLTNGGRILTLIDANGKITNFNLEFVERYDVLDINPCEDKLCTK